MLLRSSVRSIGTFKSTKDERLLERLKYINLQGGKSTLKPAEPDPQKSEQRPARNLTLNKLAKLTKQYTGDPLLWNASVLARVFNLPEEPCTQVVRYVRPLVNRISRELDEPEKILKTSFVIDVGRLISDKKYARYYNSMRFPTK